MSKREVDYYFDAFSKGIFCAHDAAIMLQKCFEGYDFNILETKLEQMHRIEHTADEIKHEMMRRLVKEFLPPIEREDIVELSRCIDNVTDTIEEVLLQMYMFHVTILRDDVTQFTDLMTKCCEALKEMMLQFQNFRKSATLQEKIIEINGLEEEGDRLYSQAMCTLYREETDPKAILIWTRIYDCLEKCFDECEDVADMVEQVILKNS